MKVYEVHFTIDGKYYEEQVTTSNGIKARELIRAKYPNAKIMSAREVK